MLNLLIVITAIGFVIMGLGALIVNRGFTPDTAYIGFGIALIGLALFLVGGAGAILKVVL